MRPQISNSLAWQQAEQLMQPAYIRIIDHLRQQLEESAWKESYRQVEAPIPGYQLCLYYGDRTVEINLWELCFKVCFQDFDPRNANEDETIPVEVDTSLLDEAGEVDWQQLDAKAKEEVEAIFTQLPKIDR